MIDEASIQYNGKAQAAISSPIAVAVKRSVTGHASSPGVRSNRTYTSASANVSTNVTIDSADP